MKIQNLFTSGKMNKDLDERLLPQGEYRDALNVKVANSNGSDVGAIENALSNEAKSSLSLGSNAVCVGSLSDDEDRVIYWFVKSDSGCYICFYDQKDESTGIVMSDTRLLTNQNPEESVLNFSRAHMIQANILTDSDNLKKFIYFTDGLNPPRRINVETAKAYTVNGFTDEDINVIVKPPLFPPSIKMKNTVELANNLQEKFLLFAYRYNYQDGEISALSPFSENAFIPSQFAFDFLGAINNSMKNSFNGVEVTYNSGSKLVKSIDIVFKESGNNNIYLAANIEKQGEFSFYPYNLTQTKKIDDNIDVVYNFKNNSIYKVLPEDEIFRLYDNVPLTAQSQEIISNRLVYGNYVENFSLADIDGMIYPINLTAGYLSESKLDDNPSKTARSNFDYEIGIVYLDEYGRSTTVLNSENNSVYVKPLDAVNQNTLTATIASKAPSFAKYYRFFVKQSKLNDYNIISPITFYADGDFLWIRLEGDDKNKVNEGDYLIIKADVTGVKKNVIKAKVLDQGVKEKDFLEETPEDGTLQQEGGYYIKIASSGTNFSNLTFITHFSVDTDITAGGARQTSYGVNFNGASTTYIEGPFLYTDSGNANDMTVTGTYSGSIDARFEVRIDSVGATDAFVWRKYDVTATAKGNFSSPINCSTSAISLSDGISISFASTTSHLIGDLYAINAKANLSYTDIHKAYATLDGVPSSLEYLTSGTKIIFSYKEYRGEAEKDKNVNDDIFIEEEVFYATFPYENIEEWFWGEGKEKFKELGFDVETNFRFRRGQHGGSTKSSNTLNITGNSSDPLCLIIQSELTRNGKYARNIFSDSTWSIFIRDRSDYAILETIPSKNNSDVFYEVPGTYEIDDCGYHKGIGSNDISQGLNSSALLYLNFQNAFSFGNGFECYKVRDAFVSNALTINNRPLTYIKNYRENHRNVSVTYSDVYEQSTNYNGLNEFNLAKANYLDLDDEYGDIQRLHSRDTDLIVFQENKVSKLLYNKSVIFNADGTGNVSQNINVFGQQIPFIGEYGISRSPHSFTSWGSRIYFADERRGAVMRLSQDGLTEISQYGMRDWFRDNLDAKNDKITIGGYDPFNGQYVVSIKNPVVEWKEDSFECGSASCNLKAIIFLTPATTTTTTTAASGTTTTTSTTTSTTTTTAAPGTTTTTTTAAPVYYYIAVRECNDYNSNGVLNDRVVRSLTNITGWGYVLIPRYTGDTNAVYQKYGSLSQNNLEIAYNAGTFDLPSVDLDTTASTYGVTVASLEKSYCS